MTKAFRQSAATAIRPNLLGQKKINTQCASYLHLCELYNTPLSLAVFGITGSSMTAIEAAVTLRMTMQQVSEHMIQFSRTENHTYITHDNLVQALLIHTDMLQAIMYTAYIFSSNDILFPETQLRCGIAQFNPVRHTDYASLVHDAMVRYQRVVYSPVNVRVCYSD